MKRREMVETHYIGLVARYREKYGEDIRGEHIGGVAKYFQEESFIICKN